MNNAAREIKTRINDARKSFCYILGGPEENADRTNTVEIMSYVKGLNKRTYYHAKLISRNNVSNGGMTWSACTIPALMIEECDVSQLSQLFTTESGKQHLSKYLLGLEACLVKD